jgi:hypothetical protein
METREREQKMRQRERERGRRIKREEKRDDSNNITV